VPARVPRILGLLRTKLECLSAILCFFGATASISAAWPGAISVVTCISAKVRCALAPRGSGGYPSSDPRPTDSFLSCPNKFPWRGRKILRPVDRKWESSCESISGLRLASEWQKCVVDRLYQQPSSRIDHPGSDGPIITDQGWQRVVTVILNQACLRDASRASCLQRSIAVIRVSACNAEPRTKQSLCGIRGDLWYES